MLVIAVDPATNTGICVGPVGGTPTLLAWKLRQSPNDTAEDIFGRAHVYFDDLVRARVPDAIAIEAPVRVKRDGKTNSQTIDITRGLYGVFCGMARAKGINLLPVEIATWRAYTLQNGRLDGVESKRRCVDLCQQLRWPAPTHDAAEAAGIWLWACGKLWTPMFGRVA